MKTLFEIRNEHEDVLEMMDAWLELNAMPEFTNLEDHAYAVAKAYWMLRKDEACTFFNGEDYPLQVSAYRWNIEQAILNRDNSKTMLQASIEYVENLTSHL